MKIIEAPDAVAEKPTIPRREKENSLSFIDIVDSTEQRSRVLILCNDSPTIATKSHFLSVMLSVTCETLDGVDRFLAIREEFNFII